MADAQARLQKDRAARAAAKKAKDDAEAAAQKKRDESGYVPCPGALAYLHVPTCLYPPPTTHYYRRPNPHFQRTP